MVCVWTSVRSRWFPFPFPFRSPIYCCTPNRFPFPVSVPLFTFPFRSLIHGREPRTLGHEWFGLLIRAATRSSTQAEKHDVRHANVGFNDSGDAFREPCARGMPSGRVDGDVAAADDVRLVVPPRTRPKDRQLSGSGCPAGLLRHMHGPAINSSAREPSDER